MAAPSEMGSSNAANPAWKVKEHVVALLEKAHTPDAEVLQDQWLPDIHTGELRQCEVVVNYGPPARQHMAIVEVQDRKKRLDIGTLESFWQKMHSLGAQSLICVSRQPFPASVRKKAVALGPHVRLMTPRELEAGEWPYNLPKYFTGRVPSVQIVPDSKYGIVYGPGPLGPRSQVRVTELLPFKGANTKPSTVHELVGEHIDRM